VYSPQASHQPTGRGPALQAMHISPAGRGKAHDRHLAEVIRGNDDQH
jgi:hypothetical protein